MVDVPLAYVLGVGVLAEPASARAAVGTVLVMGATATVAALQAAEQRESREMGAD